MGEPGSPSGMPGGVERPGEESRAGVVAAQAIEAKPAFGQIKPWRGHVVRAPNGILRRRRGGRRAPRKRSGFPGEEKETVADRKDGALIGCNLHNDHDPAAGTRLGGLKGVERPERSKCGDALIRVDEWSRPRYPTERR